MSDMNKEMSRNDEIGLVYEHLSGKKAVTQELLTEVSNLKKIEHPVLTGEYGDYAYQVTTDAKMCALMPEIIQVMSKLQFVPALMPKEEQTKLRKANDAVRVEVAQLIEKHEIPYILLDNVAKEIGGGLNEVVVGAVRTLNNKTGDCLMHLAKKEFDTDDLTMAHIAKYAEKVYAEAKK